MLLLLLALSACDPAGPAPVAEPPRPTLLERDVPYAGERVWELDGHPLELRAGTLYADGGAVLTHVYDDPVAGADTLWAPADPGDGDGGIYAVSVKDGIVVAEPLLKEGRPDRLALSPDGETLAFVSGRSGLQSVWVLPTGGGAPRQITNVGVERPPHTGRRPARFVPNPARGALRFEGERLVWTDQYGAAREATWR